MRKLIGLILVSLLFSNTTTIVNANETNDINNAINTVNEFIEGSNWDGYYVVGTNSEVIHDAKMDEYGFVFEISNGTTDGYVIVLESGERYAVAEASKEIESPYLAYDENYSNVYTSGLNYYVKSEQATRTVFSSDMLIDVITGESVHVSSLASERLNTLDGMGIQLRGSAYNTTRYLSNYTRFVVGLKQPNSSACIPTATVMGLKYMANNGRIQYYPSDLNAEVISMHTYYMGGTNKVYESEAKNGLSSYTSDRSHTNRTITFGSTWTYSPTVASFSKAQAEIDTNYPVVLMFKAGVNDVSVTHATLMIGYKIHNGRKYAMVRDPLYNNAPEIVVLYDTTNIYGHFIFYVH